MRIRKFITYLSTSIFGLFLILFCTVKANAVTSTNSYYLTEYLERDIPTNYYTVDTSATQANFCKTLHDDISKNYTRFNYSKAWEINDYCDADPLNERNVLCIYTGMTIHYQDGEDSAMGNTWNREHVWAKSHGFNNESLYPYTDTHHLRAADKSTNSGRGNKDFGEVSGSSVSTDEYGNQWSTTLYEPRDEVKGDIARMMLYMAIRYGEYEAAASDGTVFNLKLTNNLSESVVSMGNGYFGTLDTLLKWHYEDPVSVREIYRNEVIYNKYQKNRNPFIDHPEYVNYAFADRMSSLSGVNTDLYLTSQVVDSTKVNTVKAFIDAIPTKITYENLSTAKTSIAKARAAYEELNYAEEAVITNYIYLYALEAEAIRVEKVGPSTANAKIIDFEEAGGCLPVTKYNVTTPRVFGTSGINEWNAVYGGVTKTTSDALAGSQSMVLYWYLSNPTFFGYAEMNYDVKNITSVSFLAKGPVNLGVRLSYSTNGGSSWTEVNTYTMTTSKKQYTEPIAEGTLTGPVRLRFTLILPDANPTANSRLSLDNIVITATNTATKEEEFQANKTQSSMKLSYEMFKGTSTSGGYTLVTNASSLKVGDQIIIAASNYDVAMSTTQNSNNRAKEDITKEENTITPSTNTQKFTLVTGTKAGTFGLSTGSGYLSSASSSSNYLKTLSSLTDNGSWAISISGGDATFTSQGTASRNTIFYNATSTAQVFSCYDSTTTTMKPISIYKYVENGNTYTYSDVYMRFGGRIDSDLYDAMLTSDKDVAFGVAISTDGTNFTKYDCTLVKVNASYVKDDNGGYYHWAKEVEIPSDAYETTYTAKCYVVINGETYYMTEASYSAKTLAQYYVANASTLGISGTTLEILKTM